MAHDVFISYSAQDKAIADAVTATLEQRKIRCWVAPRDVLPGVPYAEAIIDALTGSRVMVLVFSSHANTSPQVMRGVLYQRTPLAGRLDAAPAEAYGPAGRHDSAAAQRGES